MNTIEKVLKEKPLDYKLMVDEIDDLTQSDFLFEVDCKSGLDRSRGAEWTQEEADKMADLLMKIYKVAHCNHCTACQSKLWKDTLV